MTDALPTQIGKYQIVELVGEGAMGTVYRAVDSILGRTVAIKVMNASIAREKDHRERFLREAQAAGSLQHPNVVTIYDLGELDGHLFIAMEFLHGTDLEKLIVGAEPLKLQSKLDIIVDVLMGLSYAHKHGIIHRDIKPGNIRVSEDGHAKIMDFGVAHLASSNMTRTGVVVGTPSYMAPEQVTGDKSVPGTDLFAVGAVLYHLLTGSKPFEGPSLQSLFYKIVTEMPRPMDEIRTGLPPALDRIARKALQKDPAKRYASALEMANEIIGVRAELSGDTYASTASLTASAVNLVGAYAPEPVPVQPQHRGNKPLITAGSAAVVLLAAWLALGQRSRDQQVGQLSGSAADTLPSTAAAAIAASQRPVTGTVASAPTGEGTASKGQPDSNSASGKVTEEIQAPRDLADTKKRTKQLPRPTPKPESKRIATPTRTAPPVPSPNRQATLPTADPSSRGSSPTPLPAPAQPQVREPEQRAVIVIPAAPPVREHPADPEPRPAPREEVAAVVAAYARAIESRDLGAVRRAYPGITAEQTRGFEQFFQAARSINVTFRVAGLETSGNSADARLVGTYEYVRTDGKSERQPVSFGATLHYEGSAWRLTSVR
ncbi:MAG: protein kinase [Gemmatimonadales bacterium]